jgi:hypothetical protein
MHLANRMLVSSQREFLLGSLYPFSLSLDLSQLQMGMHESVQLQHDENVAELLV